MFRALVVLLIAVLWPMLLYSQSHRELLFDGETDFSKLEEAFYEHWEENGSRKSDLDKFNRWKYFVEPRLVDGHIPGSSLQSLRIREFARIRGGSQLRVENSNAWEPLGPYRWDVAPGGYSPGNGRVNCITVDPFDPDRIFIGAASGGVWRSLDGGQTWETSTDKLAVLGITDIYINPNDVNEIIALTGDAYSSDTPSIGLIKSTDGGETWELMPLEFPPEGYYIFYKFEVNPQKPDTMLVAGRGVYQSTDGGASWTSVLSKWISDLIMHPTNPDIVYAVDRFESNDNELTVYKSTDGGATWDETLFNFQELGKKLGRKALAVSPDNPQAVYILATQTNSEFGGLFRSGDELETLEMQSNSPNIFGYSIDGSGDGGQGWYDLAVAVDPEDENTLYASGVHIWKSEDAGVTWDLQNNWYWSNQDYPYVHADNHTLDFYHGKLYAGCDGGIFVTEDKGETFQNLSFGLNIGQFYRLSVHPSDEGIVAGGLQDNGSFIRHDNQWSQIYGADGMEAIIDHTDPSINYSSLQNGSITRYSNFGQRIEFFFGKPANENGAWITPYIMHPKDHKTLYVGFTDVYKTETQGSNLQRISDFGSEEPIRILKQHQIFPKNMIVRQRDNVWITDDEGENWYNIKNSLPVDGYISDLEFDFTDPNTIFVTYSNWISGEKVFKSEDRGQSWTNMSFGLPSVPVNCVLSKNDCSGTLYLGTDIGVYRIDDSMNSWEPVGEGLPNVIVTELEVQRASNKLFAATYGRGIWKVEMQEPGANDFALGSVPPLEYGIAPFDLEFSTPDLHLLTVSSSNPEVLSLDGLTATIHTPGEVVITAQLEDCTREYHFVVDRASQVIDFTHPGHKMDTQWDFALEASTSSGLPITFTSFNNTIVTIEGNMAYIQKAGATRITAIQSGNSLYKPAAPVQYDINVIKDLQARINIYPNPVEGNVLNLHIPKSIGTLRVVIHDLHGRLVMERDISASKEAFELDVSELEQGMYIIKFNQEVHQFLKQ